ncbi:MAG: TatA/E family twin arginine-targeting protein translocase [Acidobacteria bacterium]|nr:TatA/E family twin arginine-targeting protein translocase [Acidobacteriota bacterium]MCL5288256.1 TatA/E family twin arginine-targeting protein translocase [Acidobacteriota bacterium]
MGPLGLPEMIFIFVLALLIFGPRKLPELGRNLGKALTEFRRASNELRATVEDEMRSLEKEARETERQALEASPAASMEPAQVDSGESAMPVAAQESSAPDDKLPRYSETPTDGDVKPV